MKRRYRQRRGPSKRRGDSGEIVVGGPHAVEAALEHAARVEHLFVEPLARSAETRLSSVLRRAQADHVPISRVGPGECDRLCGTRAQGVAARIRFHYADLDGLLQAKRGLVVFLDGIEDPHNLGAIIRSAEAAGALGVVIPQRRSAQITAAAVRVSAGAALVLPVARVANLPAAMRKAKDLGFWLIGLDHRAENALAARAPEARTGLVIGGEADGLGRLVRETCDEIARIPMPGSVESLNAAAAAAVAIYRVCEARLFGEKVC